MNSDLELYLNRYLNSPEVADAQVVLMKYAHVGMPPVFEQRAKECIEIRQPEVEAQTPVKSPRLPAKFEFETPDAAEGFVRMITFHWAA